MAAAAALWSLRERLALASIVVRYGDRGFLNWVVIARAMKPHGESSRPSDWFQQKNCAAQFGLMLEDVGGNPRHVKQLYDNLRRERMSELRRLIAQGELEIRDMEEDVRALKSHDLTEEKKYLLLPSSPAGNRFENRV